MGKFKIKIRALTSILRTNTKIRIPPRYIDSAGKSKRGKSMLGKWENGIKLDMKNLIHLDYKHMHIMT